MNQILAGVVQAASVPFDIEASVAKAERLIAKAGAKGCRLAVFPEAFIGCYPKGFDFGVTLGNRTRQGRDVYRRYFEASIAVPGQETERIATAAAAAGVHVVMGVIERVGSTLYCTALIISPTEGLLGIHRKLMPTAAERLIWGFGDGSTLTVAQTPFGKVGAVICWENYMPLLRMAMYAKGVQIYCAPTADDRDTWLPSMQHIALEGRCFVLSACQFLRRADFAEDEAMPSADGSTVLMRGGSCIIDPLGQVLAGPHFDGEAILTAPIDLDEIARAKFDFDVAGHYARPDVFQLQVDESPRPPVVIVSEPSEKPQ